MMNLPETLEKNPPYFYNISALLGGSRSGWDEKP